MADSRRRRTRHGDHRHLSGSPDGEQRRLRESLANKQLEELERLYATAPIGLGFLDTELRYIRVNERLAQINGVSAQSHVGRRLADIVPEVAAAIESVI